ncbi:MAG: tRNA lysidine(34) synthetase TilS, partial [Verrucomicrobiota bacterium]
MSRAPSIIEKGLDAKRVQEAACVLGLDRRVREEVLAALRDLKSVGLACSGGLDSVAVFAWAWAHFPRIRWTILHYDHAVRGEASAHDAAFVQDLARSLETDAVVDRWSKPEERASEARLREKRFDFFKKAVSERGLGAIVTGHHADDVVETFLMRSLRGVGVEGLSAPRPDSRGPGGMRFLRPFLSIEKDLLRQFLETLGLGWREDTSNERPQYLRNVVRKELLPKFYEVSNTAGRDGRKMLTQTRDALQRDAEMVEWAICEALQSARLSRPDALSLDV